MKRLFKENFVIKLLISIFVSYIVFFSFIILQDPFNYHSDISKQNHLEFNMYISKLNHVKRFKPPKLIIGDSIIADGINPQNYYGLESYNAGIYGIDIIGVEKYLNEITQIYSPSEVLLSLNFGQFNLNAPAGYSYNRFNNYDGDVKRSKGHIIFLFIKNHSDFHALKNSIKILLGKKNSFNSFGFYEGKHGDLSQVPQDRLRRCEASISEFQKTLTNFKTSSSYDDSIQSVKRIIDRAYMKDISLEILFPPLNKMAYQKIDGLNLSDNFRAIKEIVNSENNHLAKTYGRKAYKVLDLASLNEITSDDCAQSVYYPDAMHITEEVGNIIKEKFKNLEE